MKQMSTVDAHIAERAKKLYSTQLSRNHFQRNRMREIHSYGSVVERGGNNTLYPENLKNV
jgi:hypothetical protein